MSVDGHGIARADDLVIFVKGMIKDEVADVKIIAEIGTPIGELKSSSKHGQFSAGAVNLELG